MKQRAYQFVLSAIICAFSLTAFAQNEQASSQTPPAASTAQTSITSNVPSNNVTQETILVGTESNFPPFEFKDEQGRETGFEIELLYAIAKEENLNIEFFPIKRNKFIDGLNAKQYRIAVAAIAINAERSAQVDFSDAILDYDREIYLLDIPKNQFLKTVADFKGRTLAASRSFNTAEEIVGSAENVIKKDTFFLALKAMYQGKVDGTLGDSRVLEYFSKQYPNIKTRKISLGEEKRELAFAVQKGDTALLDKLNQGLAKVKANGTYQQLIDKWFGATK